MMVEVDGLDLAGSPPCSNTDKLMIQSGEDPNSPILATLCGKHADLQKDSFKVIGQAFRLHFVTDDVTNTGSGFEVRFHSEVAGKL